MKMRVLGRASIPEADEQDIKGSRLTNSAEMVDDQTPRILSRRPQHQGRL